MISNMSEKITKKKKYDEKVFFTNTHMISKLIFRFTETVARERTVRNTRGKASKPIDHSGKDR